MKPSILSRTAVSSFFATVLLASCSGSDGRAETRCEPTMESLRATLFGPKCATSNCHVGSAPAGSLDLTATDLVARLAGVTATECGGQTLVVPGDPARSYLYDKVSNDTPSCGSRMPLGTSPLDAAELACIRDWITSTSAAGGSTSGSTGGADASTPTCPSGQAACGSGCTDLQTDPKNCGKCGSTCAVACSKGSCVDSCPAPTTNCAGACVDTATSVAHCGACDAACSGGKTCQASVCTCGPAVSFSGALQPILTSACTSSGCHVGAQPKGGLLLTAGSAYKNLVNAPSGTCKGKVRVVPGVVDQSYLINKLTGIGMCAGSVMPKTGGELPAAQIDLFRAWICNGAPNN